MYTYIYIYIIFINRYIVVSWVICVITCTFSNFSIHGFTVLEIIEIIEPLTIQPGSFSSFNLAGAPLAVPRLAKRTPLHVLRNQLSIIVPDSKHMKWSEQVQFHQKKQWLINQISMFINVYHHQVDGFFRLGRSASEAMFRESLFSGFRASRSCSSRRRWTCSLWTWDTKLLWTGGQQPRTLWIGKSMGNLWETTNWEGENLWEIKGNHFLFCHSWQGFPVNVPSSPSND